MSRDNFDDPLTEYRRTTRNTQALVTMLRKRVDRLERRLHRIGRAAFLALVGVVAWGAFLAGRWFTNRGH